MIALIIACLALPPRASMEPTSDPSLGTVFDLCGDVDADGRDDYAIASWMERGGVVRVHSGADGSVLTVMSAPTGYEEFGRQLIPLDRERERVLAIRARDADRNDVLLLVSVASWETVLRIQLSDSSGYASEIERLGDVNRDSCDELLLDTASEFLVLSTKSGERLSTFDPPSDDRCSSGKGFVVLGDANGDGTIEVALGRRDRVLLYRIADDMAALHAEARHGRSCDRRAMAAAGDLDGDGVQDLAVGFSRSRTSKEPGEVLFFSGADGRSLGRLVDPSERPGFGAAIALGHDYDGDGVRDLLVSRHEMMVDAVLAFSGETMDRLFEVERPGDDDRIFPPDMGWDIRVGGDFDGDGVGDFLTNRYNPKCFGTPGQGVIVVSGRGKVIRQHLIPDED